MNVIVKLNQIEHLNKQRIFCNNNSDCVAVAQSSPNWNWPVSDTSLFVPCNTGDNCNPKVSYYLKKEKSFLPLILLKLVINIFIVSMENKDFVMIIKKILHLYQILKVLHSKNGRIL